MTPNVTKKVIQEPSEITNIVIKVTMPTKPENDTHFSWALLSNFNLFLPPLKNNSVKFALQKGHKNPFLEPNL